MGPNHDRQPDFSVPAATPDLGMPVQGSEDVPRAGQTPESLVGAGVQQLPAAPAMQAAMVPVNPLPATDQPAATATATPSTANPAIADDKDLIEKEWVEKAKRIVETTRDDPHKETKEMSLFKADYLKKRYNKELKVAEE